MTVYEIVDKWSREADKGNKESLYLLAGLYTHGQDDFPANPKKAIDLWWKLYRLTDASEKYGVSARYTLAFLLGDVGGIEMSFIPEGDVYRLITHSKLPEAEKFEAWVFDEVLPTIRKHGVYMASDKARALEIKEMNARTRMSNQFLKLAAIDVSMSKDYKSILIAKAAQVLAGEEILPLPKSEQKMYTATEIGKMFGVSAKKIGTGYTCRHSADGHSGNAPACRAQLSPR